MCTLLHKHVLGILPFEANEMFIVEFKLEILLTRLCVVFGFILQQQTTADLWAAFPQIVHNNIQYAIQINGKNQINGKQ